MPSHALILEPADPIELTLAFDGARAPQSGLLLTPATRITLDLDWDGAALEMSAGNASLVLEITPYIAPGTSGGGGGGWMPGGW